MKFKKGDFVEINKKTGVIVFTGDESLGDMNDHAGVWFGQNKDGIPVVWTIPTEFLTKGSEPIIKH